MKINHCLLTCTFLAFFAFTANAPAALNWYLGGNGTSLITGSTGLGTATWTGGGVIQTVPVFHASNTTATVIDNMTSGSIGGVIMINHGTFFDLDITLTPAVAGMATTADFQVRSVSSGGQGFSFTDLQNVSQIQVTTTYDQPLAARMAGSSSPRAWGFAVSNRLTNVDWTGVMTLPDLITLTSNPITNDPLVQGTDFVVGTADAGWFSAPTDQAGKPAIMNSVSSGVTLTGGAVPTLTTVGDPSGDDWIGIEGIDYNGDGDAYEAGGTETPDEALAQYSYLHTVDWTITSPGGAFASGASFNFSMDGTQYSGTKADAINALAVLVVPEPSSLALVSLSGLALLRRRRIRIKRRA